MIINYIYINIMSEILMRHLIFEIFHTRSLVIKKMKKKIIGTIVVTLLIATVVQAVGTQNDQSLSNCKTPVSSFSSVEWEKTFGGTGNDFGLYVQQTSDDGFFVVGDTTSFGVEGFDTYVVKTDPNGIEEWSKTYGGSGNDIPVSAVQTTDGGYAFTGVTTSFGAEDKDLWLVKIDSDGNMEWQIIYGGTGIDYGRTIFQTADSGYIIAGSTNSFGAGGSDFWLVKTDASGNIEWDETYGGVGFESLYHMDQTVDGGYILVGTIRQAVLFAKTNCYIVKTGSSGNMEWNKTIGGNHNCGGSYIRQTSDGGYIITGATNIFALGSIVLGGGDMWLVKIDANGNTTWEKSFGKLLFEEAGWCVEPTIDGGYIIAGNNYGLGTFLTKTPGMPYFSSAFVTKVDADGNNPNETKLGSGYNFWIEQTSDGGYITTGSTGTLKKTGDLFLIKLN